MKHKLTTPTHKHTHVHVYIQRLCCRFTRQFRSTVCLVLCYPYRAVTVKNMCIQYSHFVVHTQMCTFMYTCCYILAITGLVLIFIWCVTLFHIPYHIWSTHSAPGGLIESILEEDWHCSRSRGRYTMIHLRLLTE